MNITICLTKVEYGSLKELWKQDKRYKKGLEDKIKHDLRDSALGLKIQIITVISSNCAKTFMSTMIQEKGN